MMAMQRTAKKLGNQIEKPDLNMPGTSQLIGSRCHPIAQNADLTQDPGIVMRLKPTGHYISYPPSETDCWERTDLD